MLETVLLPIALSGLLRSIRGSLAVASKRACAEIFNPGAMAPPRYSPLSLTASNVVAVPKSTTMTALWNRVKAATPFTIRSAPTSKG